MGPITTKDLEWDQEQKDVGMAVDMEFARRAAVFIGNGVSPFYISDDCEIAADLTCFQWSTLTSNIVHRRLVDGKEPISIRFL